jgi:hemerythrin-like domain-containing protein
MTIVHNMMIRTLNAIYLQAPHIKPGDEIAFCNFTYQWWRFLHAHHTGEETHFFPAAERLSGEKGIMEVNVGQHHAFHDALDAFGDHVRECAAGTRKFNGKEIVAMLDGFAPLLVTHLNQEIPTILGLEKYGEEKMAELEKISAAEAQEVIVGHPRAFCPPDHGQD